MSLAALTLATALAAPFEAYACDGGATLNLALEGGRPAVSGQLDVAGQIVALARVKGESDWVLRGAGHMVRPFNYISVLYAPPGGKAVMCRVAAAAPGALPPP